MTDVSPAAFDAVVSAMVAEYCPGAERQIESAVRSAVAAGADRAAVRHALAAGVVRLVDATCAAVDGGANPVMRVAFLAWFDARTDEWLKADETAGPPAEPWEISPWA